MSETISSGFSDTRAQLSHDQVAAWLCESFSQTPGNAIAIEGAAPITVYNEPIFGVSDAADPLYADFQTTDIIGSTFVTPREWLPGARSVLSVFFPFTKAIRTSNTEPGDPSVAWLEGKTQGQIFLQDVMHDIAGSLDALGFKSIVPFTDNRFFFKPVDVYDGDYRDIRFESTWSERHAAYVSGLGTFSLSRGMITERGMAGRFGSLITTAPLEISKRPYSDPMEWCTRCGTCISHCPVHAISQEHIKNNLLCYKLCEDIAHRLNLGNSCGKCQVGVPCEFERPRVCAP